MSVSSKNIEGVMTRELLDNDALWDDYSVGPEQAKKENALADKVASLYHAINFKWYNPFTWVRPQSYTVLASNAVKTALAMKKLKAIETSVLQLQDEKIDLFAFLAIRKHTDELAIIRQDPYSPAKFLTDEEVLAICQAPKAYLSILKEQGLVSHDQHIQPIDPLRVQRVLHGVEQAYDRQLKELAIRSVSESTQLKMDYHLNDQSFEYLKFLELMEMLPDEELDFKDVTSNGVPLEIETDLLDRIKKVAREAAEPTTEEIISEAPFSDTEEDEAFEDSSTSITPSSTDRETPPVAAASAAAAPAPSTPIDIFSSVFPADPGMGTYIFEKMIPKNLVSWDVVERPGGVKELTLHFSEPSSAEITSVGPGGWDLVVGGRLLTQQTLTITIDPTKGEISFGANQLTVKKPWIPTIQLSNLQFYQSDTGEFKVRVVTSFGKMSFLKSELIATFQNVRWS